MSPSWKQGGHQTQPCQELTCCHREHAGQSAKFLHGEDVTGLADVLGK